MALDTISFDRQCPSHIFGDLLPRAGCHNWLRWNVRHCSYVFHPCNSVPKEQRCCYNQELFTKYILYVLRLFKVIGSISILVRRHHDGVCHCVSYPWYIALLRCQYVFPYYVMVNPYYLMSRSNPLLSAFLSNTLRWCTEIQRSTGPEFLPFSSSLP